MFFIVGSGRKTDLIGFVCFKPNYETMRLLPQYLSVNYSYVSLFFIKLLKFNRKYWITDESVTYGYEIDNDRYVAIKQAFPTLLPIKDHYQLLDTIYSHAITLNDEQLKKELESIELIFDKLENDIPFPKDYIYDLTKYTVYKVMDERNNSNHKETN